jgi:hypothetical protein
VGGLIVPVREEIGGGWEVEERSDRWVPSVSEKKRTQIEGKKEGGGSGSGGPMLGWLPGLAQLGCLLFF